MSLVGRGLKHARPLLWQNYTVKGGVATLDNGTAVFSAAQVVALRLKYFPMGFSCDAPKIGAIPLYNPSSVMVQVGGWVGFCTMALLVQPRYRVVSSPLTTTTHFC